MAGYLGGLTGWSGGGRRPITYGLMPGQMRNTRVNIFQSNYVMPMATCYYAEPPCHCEDSGMPKWMQWTMLGGMGAQLIGGILSGIFGGGSSEGAGGAKKDADAELDLRQLKTDYKNYTFSRYSDGTVRARDKNGKVIATANSPLELRDALDELNTTNTNTETETKYSKAVGDKMAENYIGTHSDKLSEGSITYNPETGKFKYNGNEYDYTELDTAIKGAKPSNSSASATGVEQSTWTQPTSISELSDPKTSPINIPSGAKTEFSNEMGTNIKSAPKSFEIKDKDGDVLYKFELVDDTSKQDSTGEPRYVCTFANKKNLAVNQKQEYFMKSDGKMYQENNTKGFGTPLGKVIDG